MPERDHFDGALNLNRAPYVNEGPVGDSALFRATAALALAESVLLTRWGFGPVPLLWLRKDIEPGPEHHMAHEIVRARWMRLLFGRLRGEDVGQGGV